ncbi:MAG: RES family NAD+ phosphorylase [Verrucomicrobiales bacterium]|nr:RES family NAD+ phosphorylase [Verrucomicrobiales bacterium]
MPNNQGPARTPLLPSANFGQRTIPVTRQSQRLWFRIHPTGSPALHFRCLPHHRFSHPKCPFPLLYLGATLQTCLWEVFGDDVFLGKRAISSARWNGCSISQIQVPAVNVCSTTLERTRDAMTVDKASLMAADLSIPQAWSLAIQKHPLGFEGIKCSSRFLNQSCLALFERGQLPSRFHVAHLGTLNDLDSAVDWLEEREAALV